MKNIYDTLEFNQIKNKVISFCVGDLAKDKITKLQPFDDLDDLKLNQKYLDQAMQLIYKYGRLPIGYYNDIETLLSKANKDGMLFGEDFVQIVYLLNNVKEIINYLSDKELEENELIQLCNQFILPKQLLKEINRCIDSSGNVLVVLVKSYVESEDKYYRLKQILEQKWNRLKLPIKIIYHKKRFLLVIII